MAKAKSEGFQSRAAWKLIEMNHTYKLFKPGMTVVDLGFAPGSWTNVAVTATRPNGRVIGIDILPAPPPKGANTFQGNFLDHKVQEQMRHFLADHDRGRPVDFIEPHSYLEHERATDEALEAAGDGEKGKATVDVVISDMLQNVSGVGIRDHSKSMDLCVSALLFCIDVLKPNGDFVCKYYSGRFDKQLEAGLKVAFKKVITEKPESSRPESKEKYFVSRGLKPNLDKNAILRAMPDLI